MRWIVLKLKVSAFLLRLIFLRKILAHKTALSIYKHVSGQAKKRPEKQIGLFLEYCILAFA